MIQDDSRKTQKHYNNDDFVVFFFATRKQLRKKLLLRNFKEFHETPSNIWVFFCFQTLTHREITQLFDSLLMWRREGRKTVKIILL